MPSRAPLAQEVAYSGIRVNAIAPGVVHTDMVEKLGEETNAVLHADMPMHRYANPEEIAGLISYLISDEASYITGQDDYHRGWVCDLSAA